MVSDLSSSMAPRKLILFDIDGTLLTPGPIPRQALAEAVSHFLGKPIELSFHDVAGFTDPTIIHNTLARHGYNGGIPADQLTAVLEHYLSLVEERLPASDAVRVYPGAEALVRSCQQESWVTALLTGNVERGAWVKLARTGLWDLFAFGIFGDDGNRREDLPWIARERAWDVVRESFRPEDTILIGDTPNDAHIARLNRIASLIVCRREEPEWRQAIEKQQPTGLVEGFDDVTAIMNLLKEMPT